MEPERRPLLARRRPLLALLAALALVPVAGPAPSLPRALRPGGP